MQVTLFLWVKIVDRKKCLLQIHQLLTVVTYFPYLQSSSAFIYIFLSNHNLRLEDISSDDFCVCVCLCVHSIFPKRQMCLVL